MSPERKLPEIYENISLPLSASEDEYPDDSFNTSYETYVDVNRRFPLGPILPLQEFAEIQRVVSMPLKKFMNMWEQKYYGGKVNWSQNKWDEVHDAVEHILRERLT